MQVKSEPLHEGTQEGSEFPCHLLMLPVRGVPVSAIMDAAVLGREIKAIHFLVAVFLRLFHHFIEGVLCNLQFFAEKHGAAEQYDLRLRVVLPHLTLPRLIHTT